MVDFFRAAEIGDERSVSRPTAGVSGRAPRFLSGRHTQGLSGQITLSATLVLSATDGPEVIGGPGANVVAVSGNNAVQVFQVNSGVTASLSGLTISHGLAENGNGGGILNWGGVVSWPDCKSVSRLTQTTRRNGLAARRPLRLAV
jgi:hypothetical protein